jgi:hypothetical protein
MLFTKFKKGAAWLQRDFEEQLKETLDANHVVNVCSLPLFEGRDRVIENMISREELEEADHADIAKQTQIEVVRNKQALIDKSRKEQLKREEAEMLERIG